MGDMFCFQCEQTAGGKGCTKVGVCGKTADVSNKQDELTGALVGLARAAAKTAPSKTADELMMLGLFTGVTNVSFDNARTDELIAGIQAEKAKLDATAKDFPYTELWSGNEDIVSLRSTLLLGLRGMAAYAWHAHVLGKDDPEVTAWLHKGMRAIG